MPTYACRINARTASITTWDPDEPLLYALRGVPSLTGAKIGCGLGQCGTCTVLVNNDAVRACMTAVKSIEGKNITTVEGLGTPDKPDPIQAAFIAESAAQCGYCTSGMVMAAKALLKRTPTPTPDQVKRALDGNLCRCGTYARILRAVLRASRARG
jgi:nicotinate dehydrogenase subunit A